MPAARQHLSEEGRFHYLGGTVPLETALAERATRLAEPALRCVPGLRGWVGVDVVLGTERDWAIEINPRLTTSYVGLRRLAGSNLMQTLLDVVGGKAVMPPTWHDGAVQFDADGTIH